MSTEEMPPEDKSQPVRRPWRKKVFIALCILFVVGAPLLWFLRQANARHTVVGKTDPVTGYHVTYTVSNFWKRKNLINDNSLNPDILDCYQFTPPETSGLQAWLDAHLLHRSPMSIKPYLERMNGIGEYAYHLGSLPGTVEDSDGHVIQKLPHGVELIKQERFSISGQPATWMAARFDIPLSARSTNRMKMYAWILMVKPRHQPILFQISGTTDDTRFRATQHEMAAIRDSLRIEKSPTH